MLNALTFSFLMYVRLNAAAFLGACHYLRPSFISERFWLRARFLRLARTRCIAASVLLTLPFATFPPPFLAFLGGFFGIAPHDYFIL